MKRCVWAFANEIQLVGGLLQDRSTLCTSRSELCFVVRMMVRRKLTESDHKKIFTGHYWSNSLPTKTNTFFRTCCWTLCVGLSHSQHGSLLIFGFTFNSVGSINRRINKTKYERSGGCQNRNPIGAERERTTRESKPFSLAVRWLQWLGRSSRTDQERTRARSLTLNRTEAIWHGRSFALLCCWPRANKDRFSDQNNGAGLNQNTVAKIQNSQSGEFNGHNFCSAFWDPKPWE